MSDEFSKVEVITGVARRRRFSTEQKLAIVAETMQPGQSISYVARQRGLSPSLIFRWRRLMSDGGKEAVAADMPEANTLTIGILAVVAQAEREAISARTKAALAAAKARGVRLGNPLGKANLVPGVGTRAASLVAKAFAVGLLPMVSELEASGLSLNAIARRFKEEGIQSRRGGRWTAKSIANLKAAAG